MLETIRAWFLLLTIIQLTLWVRVSGRADGPAEAEQDVNKGLLDDTRAESTASITDTGVHDPCSVHKNCGTCTFSRFGVSLPTLPYSLATRVESNPVCHWCSLSSTCYSPAMQPYSFCKNATDDISYEYNCPLGPVPYPDNPPTLLPTWMSEFYQAGLLENVKLVDLSLPGSHDSLSYDLSLTISADDMGSFKELARLLHTLGGKLLPGDLEEFFRMQAKTQQLTVTQQLDNGIRFLDIRIMWESDRSEWFSTHFMQSKLPAIDYLRQVRQWLDEHPQEVIVIWLSKHGDPSATGDDQYPGVSPEQKQQFWYKYCEAFDGLMQRTNETSIHETSVAELIEHNHRVISYVSDYVEFTQSSDFALDAAHIQNRYDGGAGVFEEETLLQKHMDYFKNASVNNAYINKHNGFTLRSMNTATPSWQALAAAKRQFVHWLGESPENTVEDNSHNQPRSRRLRNGSAQQSKESRSWATDLQAGGPFSSCSSNIKIPGVDEWCPMNLLDICQLASYYNQIAIEEAFKHSFNDKGGDSARPLSAFPNAFYLDGLDYGGTIRIGPELLDGSVRGGMGDTKDAKYALVDTVLAYNARVACKEQTTDSANGSCDNLMDRIKERRAKYPLCRWEEPSLGRHDDWPPYSYDDAPSDKAAVIR